MLVCSVKDVIAFPNPECPYPGLSYVMRSAIDNRVVSVMYSRKASIEPGEP
jgi:hypothetical protein